MHTNFEKLENLVEEGKEEERRAIASFVKDYILEDLKKLRKKLEMKRKRNKPETEIKTIIGKTELMAERRKEDICINVIRKLGGPQDKRSSMYNPHLSHGRGF